MAREQSAGNVVFASLDTRVRHGLILVDTRFRVGDSQLDPVDADVEMGVASSRIIRVPL
jgi:hypothetical protein